jgi:hypothetical protein
MNIADLNLKLRQAFSAETSYSPSGWTPDNPAYAHCSVVACIVQDEFGGEIMGADYIQPNGIRGTHFWNAIGGKWEDLTRDQIPQGTIIKSPRVFSTDHASLREFLLSDKETQRKYHLLKSALKMQQS